ncbi:hypothetical protein [Acrocarpospora sp. B8E8]|uniref:hypothetical protein n=1 Tax=Acrocarpospora sp. B8E8 TaxID=3153572 RepID=UPI00325F84D5
MARRVWRIKSIAVAIVFVLSGCGNDVPPEPTAAEAGEVLKSHIDQTLKYLSAAEIKITDPGGKDIPCGNGKYKRTYAAEAEAGAGTGDSDVLATILVGALISVAQHAEYELIASHLTAKVAVSAKFRTRIVLYSPGKEQMAARGETDCLLLK